MPGDTRYDESTGIFRPKFQGRRAKNETIDERLASAMQYALGGISWRSPVIDIGAGTGRYATWLRQNGFPHTEAWDGDDSQPGVRRWNLIEPFPEDRNFDAGIFIETGEHVPAEHASRMVRNISTLVRKRLIVSWATPGQRGLGHVNCLRPEQVTDMFVNDGGWTLDTQRTVVCRKLGGKHWNDKLLVFTR